eukprot:IDg17028t1
MRGGSAPLQTRASAGRPQPRERARRTRARDGTSKHAQQRTRTVGEQHTTAFKQLAPLEQGAVEIAKWTCKFAIHRRKRTRVVPNVTHAVADCTPVKHDRRRSKGACTCARTWETGALMELTSRCYSARAGGRAGGRAGRPAGRLLRTAVARALPISPVRAR